MITVRFDTGFAVQYNSAAYVTRHQNFSDLYTKDPKEGGSWVAQVPLGALIEVQPPCRLYVTVGNPDDLKAHIELLAKEVRSIKRKMLK